MGYPEATEYLDALGVDAMKKLDPLTRRIEALCDLLDHPEQHVSAIHITGTNGKTSTARIAASLLSATGLSVGTYTSPHLESIRERITLGGEPISEEAFGEVFDHIFPYVQTTEARVGERLSYFEVLTGMFFLWAAENVDAAVVEVGLGGRWDATNVLPRSVPVITNVGLDHTAMLGSDRATIAREKAGVVKPGSALVTAERTPEIVAILGAQAAEVVSLGRDFEVLENRVALGGRYLSVRTSRQTYEGLFLPLHGRHQGTNAATALEAVTRFLPSVEFSNDVVLEGMAAVRVPGRLETLRTDTTSVPVVMDVAHNPDGMSAMITSLAEAFAFDRIVFILGVLQDKDHDGMLTEMARLGGHVIATEAKTARSVPAQQLADAAQTHGMASEVVTDVAAALHRATQIAREADLICVTGSHYVVGEARSLLLPSGSPTAVAGER